MSNSVIIQVLFFCLLVMSFVLAYLIHLGRKQIEEKQKYTIFLPGKRNGNYYYKLYDFLINWPITKKYVRKITRHYEIIMPGDKKRIYQKTVRTVLTIWLMDAVLIILLFALKPSFYKVIITITYIYLLNNHTLRLYLEKNEIELMLQTDKLMSDVRHNYQIHGMIDEAIYDSIEESEYPVKLHAMKIYSILNSSVEDLDEEVSKFNDTVPNRFLKIFLALCVSIIKFGDKEKDNQSLFLTNLRYLKQEINIEVLYRQRIRFLFSGLVVLVALPVLFLKSIQYWAINCFSELKNYYYGAFGIASMIAIFLITIATYQAINRLKDINAIEIKNYVLLEWLSNKPIIKQMLNNILNKNYGRTLRIEGLLKKVGESISVKQFLLKRILYSIITFICCIVIAFTIHGGKRTQLLNNADAISKFSSMVSQKEIKNIKDTVLTYVNEYRDEDITVDEVKEELLKSGVIKSKELATLTAEEIVSRVVKYQNEYFKWYELVFAFFSATIAFYLPYIIVLILKRMRQMAMEDEVIQFHSIILMLMYMDRMTIETILTWMENFSVIFKKSLQECINDLQSGDIEALEELKKKEPFEPFIRIIENLQMCDKIPIEKAFDEIAIERYNYQENRKLQNEVYIKNKTTLATALAWLPLITTGIYLIVPWIIEALMQFFTYMDQMNNVMK